MNNKTRFNLGYAIAAILAVFVIQYFISTASQIAVIPYSEYQQLLKQGKVATVGISDRTLQGTLKEPLAGGQKQFVTTRVDQETAQELEKYNVRFTGQIESTFLRDLLSWTMPVLLFFGLWWYIGKRAAEGGGLGGGLMAIGKSKAKIYVEADTGVNFSDVAGVDEAKDELREVVDFLKSPTDYGRLGGRMPKGVLLVGPPGTGKTLLAKAIAGEAGVPFFSISGSDFVEMFVGVGASRVRDLFEQGKKHAPCIIFIDEIDAVGRLRGAGLGGGHDEREQTLNQLLVEMDGFDTTEGVILIAATNRPDVLDPALLRPGRFDRQITVNRPDVRGRTEILKVHTKKVPLSKDVDLEIISRGTPGFSGADLENLVNEAALLAARLNKTMVELKDFEFAKDKVLMGVERKSMVLTDEEKRTTAYHEAGHAMMARLLPGTDPVHKVTIIPRGRALGITMQLPTDDRHSYSKEFLYNTLAILMGGRVAEELIFNQITTGAGNDLERATDLARKMVCEWGMSEELGPLTYGKKDEEIFLGREIATRRDYSEEIAIKIDTEVKRLVSENYERTKRILLENMAALKALAEALLEKEVLDAPEIDKIIQGAMSPIPQGIPA